ncbi:hypothetical protein FIBSPDRAFT_740689 [Athelia psychrophila]|uniref:Uncharacterized protein n=2 Tax=Athelia psychrophila TaxID=1759441 RepID=A0A166K219_9AGAM|nr:hypothetical protein FIBSPDRAFT_740689 [Fibularhizoctonia sp. CBS 109695]
MEWMITGSSRKSIGEVDRLAKTVLTHADFRLSDLAGFSAKRENKVLDASEGNQPLNPADGDGWLQSNVSICIPTGVVDPNGSGKLFLVPGLWHRPLLPVMKAALADASARWFHFSPFKRLWKSPSGTEHRVFDEAYTSDAWIEAHDKLQKQPNEPGCQLEKVVLGLMLSSDATHLTNFGTAKLWPVYLYFANLSKYIRWDRNSGAAHHIAYLPSLPDSISDAIPAGPRKAMILTHCRRELLQGSWDKMLDPEFVASYKHGFKMECLDGVWRRFYPRIFTYSADYKEKILLATIRDLGICPCPRCLVKLEDVDKLGYVSDMKNRISSLRTYSLDLVEKARDFIYKLGLPVCSAAVDRLLKGSSWTPTINTFAKKLQPLGLEPFVMLAVDFLHEFELGVWKAVFQHLMRILHVAAPNSAQVAELDRRYDPSCAYHSYAIPLTTLIN